MTLEMDLVFASWYGWADSMNVGCLDEGTACTGLSMEKRGTRCTVLVLSFLCPVLSCPVSLHSLNQSQVQHRMARARPPALRSKARNREERRS